MIVVPMEALPSQTVQIQLNGQNCQLNVYTKFFGLYMDILVNDVLVIGGVVCRNLNRIVRSKYLGFTGDFAFVDTLDGNDDPIYQGLGTQFQLVYFTPAEVEQLIGVLFGEATVAG